MKKLNKHYRQFTQEPGYQISALRKAGSSIRAIAGEVGVHLVSIDSDDGVCVDSIAKKDLLVRYVG